MTNTEMLKLCREEILFYEKAPDELNDEQDKWLDFFESVRKLLTHKDKCETNTLKLTPSQVNNLIEFFELNFIDSIRNDPECDNINYLVDMCDIYKQLTEKGGGQE